MKYRVEVVFEIDTDISTWQEVDAIVDSLGSHFAAALSDQRDSFEAMHIHTDVMAITKTNSCTF